MVKLVLLLTFLALAAAFSIQDKEESEKHLSASENTQHFLTFPNTKGSLIS